jgi:hypothetical protein
MVAPGAGRLLTGAGLGACAALTRSTILAAWPVVLLLAAPGRRHRQSIGRVIALLLAMALIVSLATLRNWIVAGQLVPITTSMAVNLAAGNPPPRGLRWQGHHHWWLPWLATEAQTVSVVEYAFHFPGSFTRGLTGKAAYALGLESLSGIARPDAFATARGVPPTLSWIWIAAVCGGLVRVWQKRSGVSPMAQSVPLLVALCHLAVVVLIFPYDERFVLPFYALLLPYAAIPFGKILSSESRGS